MSILLMSWAWSLAIPTGDKLVMMALADHSDDDGFCWPGTKGVAKKCGLDQRSVLRHLAHLELAGFVKRLPRYGSDGSQQPNLYQLCVNRAELSPPDDKLPPTGDKTVIPPMAELSPPDDTSVVPPTTPASSPQPSLEPLYVRTPPIVPPLAGGDPAVNKTFLKKPFRNDQPSQTEDVATNLPPAAPPKVPWLPPAWFEPMTRLDGYKAADHSRAVDVVGRVCEAVELDPKVVVAAFAEYWPIGRVKHRWLDPTKALVGSIDVQIRKVKHPEQFGANGNRPLSLLERRQRMEARADHGPKITRIEG